jgi:hypothetical protein
MIKETRDGEMANQGVSSFLLRFGVENILNVPPNFQFTNRDRTKLYSEGLAATIAMHYPNLGIHSNSARGNALATCVATR